ncbi:MAG: hypothetical protein HY555_00775 [Euryarchaeota archaeon]|nr:hypothetical protein [Euryarchaeota archaeon]
MKVVVDKEQAGNRYSEDERLIDAGVEVKYDQNPALMQGIRRYISV